MPLAAVLLLLVAAGLHATWNLLVKRAREKLVFTWWSLLLSLLLYSPLLLLAHTFPLSIWPYILSSALMEALYFLCLVGAYQYGDFSLVYPMARGTAPALLTLWAVLFLGERPDLPGYLGLTLIIIGLIVTGASSWWRKRKTTPLAVQAIGLALATACCVSIYSAIDGAAVRQVDPLPYTVLVIGLSGVMITPLMLVRYGKRALVLEMRSNWRPILAVGVLGLLAYMLALLAYSFAPISYSGAIREVSIVFAAFIGWRWLGERFGTLRLVGSLLIFVGILVVALAT